MLPWLELATRTDPVDVELLNDCETCMIRHDATTRQLMGCGYEPAVPGAQAWQHPGDLGEAPATCAGYTTKLPVVREVTWARWHHSKGQLSVFTGGAPATPVLVDAIEVLESSECAARAYEQAKREADRRAKEGR